MPMPGFLCATPVLMKGAMPLAITLRTSMPSGVPRKLSTGTVKNSCSPAVIWYISCVTLNARSAVPPTKRTMAGAAAIAKPPMPPVSVMLESPMSGLASSAE